MINPTSVIVAAVWIRFILSCIYSEGHKHGTDVKSVAYLRHAGPSRAQALPFQLGALPGKRSIYVLENLMVILN